MDRFVMFYLQNRHRGPTLKDALLNLVFDESGRAAREMKARLSMSAPPPTASLRWTTREHRGQQTGIRQQGCWRDGPRSSTGRRETIEVNKPAFVKTIVGESGRDEGAIVNVCATANGKPPLDDVRPSRTTNRHSSTGLLTRRAEMKARLSMSAPPPTASLRWTIEDNKPAFVNTVSVCSLFFIRDWNWSDLGVNDSG
ncbi:Hypothetical predicted protein [Cloeon dipterum]|uniref:Uncharacterized protein n=1 Tax=Cloeon dipterum TaxID=197152 RepID=A0A8S1DKX9_9INSE|nr:Hypothetical predicted protein [Cloeon dipterum]